MRRLATSYRFSNCVQWRLLKYYLMIFLYFPVIYCYDPFMYDCANLDTSSLFSICWDKNFSLLFISSKKNYHQCCSVQQQMRANVENNSQILGKARRTPQKRGSLIVEDSEIKETMRTISLESTQQHLYGLTKTKKWIDQKESCMSLSYVLCIYVMIM